jgi:hypothetical protein
MSTLDFTAISAKVPFRSLLTQLDIGFEENRQGELKFRIKNKKGIEDYFVVNEEKNLFLTPETKAIKGGPINFMSWFEGIGLYQAAKKLTEATTEPQVKREIPTLELHPHEAIDGLEHLLKYFEFGYCKKGIMAGKIAFQVKNPDGSVAGYVGQDVKTGKWLYPKDFKRPIYNIEKATTDYCILTISPFDVLHIANQGCCYVVGLLGKTITDYQLEQMKRFKRILLLAEEPQQPLLALSQFAYVKAPKLDKPIQEIDDISKLF